MLLQVVSLKEQLLVLKVELPKQSLVLLGEVGVQRTHGRPTLLLLLLLLVARGGERLREGAALTNS